MGLFHMIGDVLGSLHDMKSLGGMQEEIESAIEGLIQSGKCPDALKQVFEATKENPEGQSQEDSMKKLMAFAKSINEHKDLLPEEIQKKAGKYLDVVKDLKEKAEDITNLTHSK